jgi:hypothetical protein
VKQAKVEDDCWWRSDRIGKRPGVGCGYFGMIAMRKAKDMMGSIVGGGKSIALCG